MARYGDLYTPASNYGKVYRGSLASRQKSIEQAGDNMANFAGEIYNLVQKEREAPIICLACLSDTLSVQNTNMALIIHVMKIGVIPVGLGYFFSRV